jgi:hypothetical protein
LAIASPKPVSLAAMSSLRILATLFEPRRLAEFEGAGLIPIVEDRASIGARKIDGAIDYGLQHDFQIQR